MVYCFIFSLEVEFIHDTVDCPRLISGFLLKMNYDSVIYAVKMQWSSLRENLESNLKYTLMYVEQWVKSYMEYDKNAICDAAGKLKPHLMVSVVVSAQIFITQYFLNVSFQFLFLIYYKIVI